MTSQGYPYQDQSLSAQERATDLVGRLSLEEKAGLMFHTIAFAAPLDYRAEAFGMQPSTRMMLDDNLSHFNIVGNFNTAKEYAEWCNSVQAEAAKVSRWGIPVTFSTDPRHAFAASPQMGMSAGFFSQWPEHIGFAALRDPKRMREYCDIVRREYMAVGMRAALHPQIDLATQPLWSRIYGGLGEDAQVASELATAHIRGLQTDAFGSQSVSACAKHFPGGGPCRDGLDPHFAWGKEQDYPGGKEMFEYHLAPFRAAVDAGVRVIMPSYGLPTDLDGVEPVAMAFNKKICTDLLRGELGFKGVVLSDWAILKNMGNADKLGDLAFCRCWGVEGLSTDERVVRALDAGIDQFGGDGDPNFIINVVKAGLWPESRLDPSVHRILVEKFELGVFDSPFVDADDADKLVGTPENRAKGLLAQKDCTVLLKNGKHHVWGHALLPLKKGTAVYLENFSNSPSTDVLAAVGARLVSGPKDADAIIIRMATAYEHVGRGEFTKMFHHGSLVFPDDKLKRVKELAKLAPVVADIYMDRPPVLGSINDDATAIIANFGLQDDLLIEVAFGHSPKGKLPFDLPRSMAAVEASRCDTPFDTADPVYRFGEGLSYAK